MKTLLSLLLLLLSIISGGGRPLVSRTVHIDTGAGRMKARILRPKEADGPVPGILWIHGGGYMLGGSYMLDMSCGKLLAKEYGAVVVCPDYRLAGKAPFPAALEDCYAALEWMYENADELGIDRKRIIVGGESAGGGLTVAVCLYNRDKGSVPVAMQIPLYPMLDCEDTESSSDNHGKVWNTKRNHWGWKHYLGEGWRIPSRAEIEELMASCQWTWTKSYNGTGVSGYIVTGQEPGFEEKSIFLPTAGYIGNVGPQYAGPNGSYWSSELYNPTASPIFVYCLTFDFLRPDWGSGYRFHGRSIRPVFAE